MTDVVVTAAGWATTIQDGGRPGHGAVGVPASGALDEPLRQVLNRLVGNPGDAAVLETLGGLQVTVTGPAVVATSAEPAPRTVAVGEVVDVGPADGELWGYLAVRGGLAVAPVLGSRSTETRSGLGPPVPVAGVHLPIGRDPATPIVADVAPRPDRTADLIGVHVGPRATWFEAGTLEQLAASAWVVSSEVSRVGVRLDGPPLRRSVERELPSEGVLHGAVQVPPDGRPVVMLADHPTTGGYPVLAVVDPPALAVLAQRRPGTAVRFRLLQ